MSWRLLTNRDTIAAIVLLAFGGAVLVVGRGYETGTLTEMGSGYFPMALGIVIVLFGLALLAQSIIQEPVPISGWHARPLAAVIASIVLFASLIGSFGLLAATAGLVVLSRLAAPPYRPVEVVVLAAGLAALAAAIFILLLALPIRAW